MTFVGDPIQTFFDSLRPSMETQRLEAFVHANPGERILEIGSGNGSISLRLAYRFPKVNTVLGIDLFPDLLQKALKARKDFEIQFHIPLPHLHFAVWDAANPSRLSIPFDVIICNPPFFCTSESRPSPNTRRNHARRDETLTPAILFQCINNHLTQDGYGYVVYPKKRLKEIEQIAQSEGFFIDEQKIHPEIRKRDGGIGLLKLKRYALTSIIPYPEYP